MLVSTGRQKHVSWVSHIGALRCVPDVGASDQLILHALAFGPLVELRTELSKVLCDGDSAVETWKQSRTGSGTPPHTDTHRHTHIGARTALSFPGNDIVTAKI